MPSRLWRKLLIFFRKLWNRLRRLPASPHNIAFGFAIGIFVSFLPIIPFQILFALFLAFVLRGNAIAAFLGVNLHIPLIFLLPFIYIGEYKLGHWILGTKPLNIKMTGFSIDELINLGLPLALGSLIISFLAGITAYIITYYSVKAYKIIWQKKKLKYMLKKSFEK